MTAVDPNFTADADKEARRERQVARAHVVAAVEADARRGGVHELLDAVFPARLEHVPRRVDVRASGRGFELPKPV